MAATRLSKAARKARWPPLICIFMSVGECFNPHSFNRVELQGDGRTSRVGDLVEGAAG